MRRPRAPLHLVAPLLAVTALAATLPGRAEAPPADVQSTVPSPAIEQRLEELARWVNGRGGKLSAAVVDVASARALASSDAHLALNPASNMKVVTAAAALDLLGPTHAFKTELHGKLQDGRIAPLVLRGYGDPSLTTAALWRLARSLASRGVREVDGLEVDQSYFDDQFVPPAFDQQPDEWATFRAPVSAVSLNGNTVTLSVLATSAGEPARVWFDPPGFVQVRGTVVTKPAGAGQGVRLTTRDGGPGLLADVAGYVAEGVPRLRFSRRTGDPRLLAGRALAELLRAEGIQVGGDVALGGAGVQGRLTFVESEPLPLLLRRLGKQSDNFHAETLLKVLGARSGTPASSAEGARVVTAWLASDGPLDTGVRIENGSGLFDANRLSAHTLTTVLRRAYRDPRLRSDFVSQLAVGGVDGTLRSRLRRHRDRHVVRAKTGTLDRAIALSGYVLDASGGAPVAFSFLVEGIAGAHTATRTRIDRVVDEIVARVWP